MQLLRYKAVIHYPRKDTVILKTYLRIIQDSIPAPKDDEFYSFQAKLIKADIFNKLYCLR